MEDEVKDAKPRSGSKLSEPGVEASIDLSWEYEAAGPETAEDSFEESAIDQQFTNSESDPVAEALCSGLLERFLPPAESAHKQLDELTHSQRVLIETLQQENGKFSETEGLQDADDMFKKTREYLGRLHAVSRQMHSITERAHKLKKRATHLQQQAQRTRLQAEVERDKQIEYDRKLKPVIRRPPDEPHPDDETKPL